MEPYAFVLALDANRSHVLSARPDAPVVPERPPRRPRRAAGPGPARRAAAAVLRRLADRLEPRCTPATAA